MSEGKTSWTNRIKIVNDYWTNPKEIPEYRVKMLEAIIEELNKNKENTLMDCGCGTGLLFEYLPDKYKDRYYGVDFTQEMIDYCKNQYPDYEDRFKRMDLTKINNEDRQFFDAHAIYVTQNVMQHILLFQEALDNIFYSATNVIILCERTHELNTCIVGYEPAYRWRFNLKDFYDILNFYKTIYDYAGDIEILGQPKTTDDIEKAVTMFRVYRYIPLKLSSDILKEYNDKYFNRVKTVIRKRLPPLSRKQRIINFIKKVINVFF